jgi:hypothetical protein
VLFEQSGVTAGLFFCAGDTQQRKAKTGREQEKGRKREKYYKFMIPKQS